MSKAYILVGTVLFLFISCWVTQTYEASPTNGEEDSKESDNNSPSGTSSSTPPTSPNRVQLSGSSRPGSPARLVTNTWTSSMRQSPMGLDLLRRVFGRVKSMRTPGPFKGTSSETEVQPLPKLLNDIVDFNQNPCDDFEVFSSGKGVYSDSWTLIDQLEEKLNELIAGVNDGSSTSQPTTSSQPNGSQMLVNIRNLYQSCITREETFATNKKRFFELMTELGSSSLLQWELGWDQAQGDPGFRFIVSMIRLFRMGLMEKQPIKLDVLPDPDDTSRLLLHIDQPAEQLMLVETSLMFNYNRFKLLNLAINQLISYEEIEEVHRFAKTLRDVRGKRQIKPTKMRLDEFTKKFPEIDWKHLVHELLGKQHSSTDGNDYILVSNEEYVSLLGKLVAVSSDKVIPNYIFLNLFEKFGGFLEKKLGEGTGRIDCLRLVRDEMSLPLSVELKRGEPELAYSEKLAKVNNLVEVIRAQFETNIKRATWMTPESKEMSLEKLAKLEFFLSSGSMDESNYDHNLAIDQFGSDMQLDPSSFMDNILAIRKKIASFKIAELRRPSRKASIWLNLNYKPSLTLNLIDEANVIDIPGGILQAPFFDTNQPDYMNYASLGFLITKTLMKAFDLRGCKYNSEGRLVDIWDGKTVDQYKALVRIYSNNNPCYRREEVRVTLLNNIIGLRASQLIYEAYESRVAKSNISKDLGSKLGNGITLTPEQLLLICLSANISINHEQSDHYNDFPCPNRVNQIFSNLDQFNNQFDCPVGSIMRPKNSKLIQF